VILTETVARAHKFSTRHRERLSFKDLCGCFYCKDQFVLSDVEEWVDDNTTALCPSRGVDSVVGMPDMVQLGVSLNDFDQLLTDMNTHWFSVSLKG